MDCHTGLHLDVGFERTSISRLLSSHNLNSSISTTQTNSRVKQTNNQIQPPLQHINTTSKQSTQNSNAIHNDPPHLTLLRDSFRPPSYYTRHTRQARDLGHLTLHNGLLPGRLRLQLQHRILRRPDTLSSLQYFLRRHRCPEGIQSMCRLANPSQLEAYYRGPDSFCRETVSSGR